MRALLAIATLITLSAWSGPGCSPSQAPAPEPTTMPGMPDHDAGLIANASCKTACATLERLDCSDMWPASGTCLQGCKNLTEVTPAPHLLACWTRAKTSAAAHACKE